MNSHFTLPKQVKPAEREAKKGHRGGVSVASVSTVLLQAINDSISAPHSAYILIFSIYSAWWAARLFCRL